MPSLAYMAHIRPTQGGNDPTIRTLSKDSEAARCEATPRRRIDRYPRTIRAADAAAFFPLASAERRLVERAQLA